MTDTNTYVVADKVNGAFEYLAFDSASGGYPYVSKSIRDMTNNLHKAITWLADTNSSYAYLADAKVYQIILKEIDISKFLDKEKEFDDMLGKLSHEEKTILKNKLKTL